MERSTLRTSTPSGTVSTVGAKFRMLVTPASTSRSQTCWAAPGGVVMTPIETCWLSTMDSSSSMWRTGRPAALLPTTVGSASSRAATRKPREAKPP